MRSGAIASIDGLPTVSRDSAFKRILIATDFSQIARHALEYAVSFGQAYGSHLYLLHVLDPEQYPNSGSEGRDSALENESRLLQQKLDELRSQVVSSGLPCDPVTRFGHVSAIIQNFVSEHSVDLLVMGTHGGSYLGRLSLGSCAQETFRGVACPVLTVGPRVFREAESEIRLRHILCAINGDPQSARAALYALGFASQYDADLTFLHVTPEIHGAAKAHDSRLPESVLKGLSRHGVDSHRARLVFDRGCAATVITNFATEVAADLIVMGAKKHPRLEHSVEDGTAYRVMCEADCPVLTIPSVISFPSKLN